MEKYVIGIDYKAATKKGLEYRMIKVENFIDAMVKADQMKTDDVYLVSIMKKVGSSFKSEAGRCQVYEAILTRRDHWHYQDEEGHRWAVKHTVAKFGDWFETV